MARYRTAYRNRIRLWENARVSRDTAQGLAIASLVCGVLGLFVASVLLGPVAVVTGGLALHREAGLAGTHRGLAVAGLVLGTVAVVLVVISLLASIGSSGSSLWHW